MKIGTSKFSSPSLSQQQNRALNGQLTIEENISAKSLPNLTLQHNREVNLTHGLKRLPQFVQAARADKVINFEIDKANSNDITFRPILPSALVTKNDVANLGNVLDYVEFTGVQNTGLSGLVDTGAGTYALNIDVSSAGLFSLLEVGKCVYVTYSGANTTIGGIDSSELFPGCFPIIAIYQSGPTKYIYLQTTTNNGFTATSGTLSGVYTIQLAPTKWKTPLSSFTAAGKTILPYLSNKTAIKDFYKLRYKFTIEINTLVGLNDKTISFYPNITTHGTGEGITITFKTIATADSPSTYQYYVTIGASTDLTAAALITKLQAIAEQTFISGTDNGVYWKEMFALSRVANVVTFQVLPKDYVLRVEVSDETILPFSSSNLEISTKKKYFGGENCYGRSGPPLGKGYTHVSYLGEIEEIDVDESIIPIRWQDTYSPSGGLAGSYNFVCFSTPEYSQALYETNFPSSNVGLVRLSFAAYPVLDFIPVAVSTNSSNFMGNLATALAANLGNYLVSKETSGGVTFKVRLHRQFFIEPPNANSVFVPDENNIGFAGTLSNFYNSLTFGESSDTSRVITVSNTNGFTPGTKFYIIETDGTIDDGYVVESVTSNTITYTGAKAPRLSSALEILQVSEALVNVLIF